MSLREEQCKKVCRILDNVLANRPTERDSLILAVRKAFDAMQTAEPKRETTTLRIGRTRNSVTMWYECAECGEPVDQEDAFCRRCGRGIIHE